MKTLKNVDVVITDPPYGINRHGGFSGAASFGGGLGRKIERKQYHGNWDHTRPNKEVFAQILSLCNKALIFGGNYFSDLLPVSHHWIVWDKLNTMPTFGDCELIWTNIDRRSVKKVTRQYNGLLGKEGKRYHATQKPISIMLWLIENYTNPNDVIFDPYMGSGTTGVACMILERSFIGCEIDEQYFQIAQDRITNASLQPSLFGRFLTKHALDGGTGSVKEAETHQPELIPAKQDGLHHRK